ncbi:hypothetical protein [Pedobacter sp. V48]|uniref:hypothetical protein n=1 Tax=Pedobacter sp. V48 TaxID=509635 RepID=UPI0003E47F7E|nr:hypothetical protein [Pedobacter sp. V48]ETZ22849.1 hypothetical protein N824_21405 [Pedobacter sp. V48]
MNETQKKIYEGLKQISPEIGAFYKDALMIMGDDCLLSTKANLIAHLSREIDGGFRDIFAPKLPETKKKEAEEKEKLEDNKEGHRANIIRALGFENDKISKEWLSLAHSFNKFAHRHGHTPRTFEEFKGNWDRYEKILHVLTGSAYAITDRINHIVKFDTPTKLVMGSVKQIMEDPVHRFQFFSSLKAQEWLLPLYEAGFFSSDTYPKSQHEEEWFQLRYLLYIAKTANEKQQGTIIQIIRNLQQSVVEGKTKINDHTISFMLGTLAKLPNYVLNENDIDLLVFLNGQWVNSHKFYESNFTEGFLKNHLETNNKEGLIKLLTYCFSFDKQEIKIDGFEELGLSYQKRVIPNLSEPYLRVINQHIPEIIKIGGINLIEQLAVKLNELYIARPYELSAIPSIEISEQSSMYSGDWESSLVDFLTKSGETLSPGDLKIYVKLLFSQQCVTHSRIAIHLIRLHYSQLSSLFWEWLKSQKLDVLFPIHELYLLIRERFKNLSDEDFNMLITWIENITFQTEHLSPDEIKASIILRIRQYLDALKPEKEDQQRLLQSILTKYQDENSHPLEHPEFDGYSTAGYAYDFPEDVDELKEKSVAEQISYLSGFIIPDHFNNIPMGLGTLMNNYIIDEPEKYLSKLHEMGKLPLIYLEQFISSFCHVMKNGALPDWKKPMDSFISWSTENNKSGKTNIYELASFLLLLSESNDTYQFTEDNLDLLLTKTVHLLSLDDYKTLEHLNEDYSGFMLNDGNAKLFDALVNFSRLWAKLQSAGTSPVLHPHVKDYLESNLSRISEKDKVFSIGLGMHIPFFHYADSDWCISNVDKIFPAENKLHFLYTIIGVFSNRYLPSKSVIKYMYDTGLNSSAVKIFQKDSPELNRLCRLALVEYFFIDPSVINKEQSLLSLIIAEENPLQFEKLINVCINLEKSTVLPVIELWQRVLDKCLTDPDKFKSTINSLVLLSDNLSELSADAIALIETCVSYLNDGRSSYILIRNLLRLSEKIPDKVSELLLKIWEQTGIRPYANYELKQFVGMLYIKGMQKQADEICMYVASTGNLTLKPIYDHHHLDQF